MFDSLSERLGGILDRLTRRGALTEADVDAALREVRRALLEADVALDVVRAFVDKVKSHAVGVEVIKSVTPGQMVVKIVHDQLIDTLGTRGEPIDLNAPPPVPIMMVGLQGSGKTTTTAKLAKRLVEQARRKVLMASLDVRRPAAMEQLAVLGQQVNVDTLPIVAGQQPAQIAQRALQAGRLGGYDAVILDTAGRTTLDEAMMAEAADVKRAANPHEVLLVADALTGQDAVNLARAFNDRVGLTGIVLTRVDGDGRGGAALSMRAVTGKPIKLLGTGDDRRRESRARRREDAQGRLRSRRLARAARADAADGGHGRADGDAARYRQDEESARIGEPRRTRAQAPGGDHRFDDAAGAQEPRRAQGEPQETHRRGLRHQGRGRQPHAQNAPRHGRRDEGDGLGQARTDGGVRQYARAGGRHAERARNAKARAATAGRIARTAG